MGDSVQIPWELSGRSVNPLDAAAAGLAQGQKIGALNALKGLDINNPDTFGKVTNALAHVGALDQAGGIYALQGARLKNSILNAGFQAYGDMIKGNAPSSQPQANATSSVVKDDGTVDYGAMSGDQKVHMLQGFGEIDRIEQQISQLPYADRRAALDRLAAPLIQRGGIDPKAVSDFDPTDENIASMLARHDQARTAILNPRAAAEAPAAPAAPTPAAPAPLTPAGTPGALAGAAAPVSPSPGGSSGIDLRDPHTQGTIGMLGLAGMDVAPMIQMGTAVIPNYTAGSGGVLFNPKTGAQLPGHVGQNLSNVNGQMVDLNDPHNSGRSVPAPPEGGRVLYDNQGNPVVVPVQGYQGVAAGVAGAVSGAQAGAQAAATAPYEMVPGMTGPNGEPLYRTRADVAAGNIPEHGASPAQVGLQQAQAKEVSDTIAADTNARSVAMAARDEALRNLTIAGQMPFNPATPHFAAGANALRALPAPILKDVATLMGTTPEKIDQYATNAAVYTQASNGLMLSYARSHLPSRYAAQELNIVRPIIGQIKDPNGAAQNMDALLVAMHNREIARAAYAEAPETQALVSKNPSKAAYEAGWAASPAGRASLFADPVFRSFNVGGKPAVETFNYKGRDYLAVYPGLGKPTIIPAN